jgi:MFS family permease
MLWLPRHASLAALQHRNFRLLWLGTLLSMGGSMMRQAALLWQVSLLVPAEQKALALGGVGLVRFVPLLICSLFAGVVADALDRRRVMLVTNSVLGVVSALLALLTWSGQATLGGVYALAALTAAVGTFDNPARNALFPTLVPREALPNAISLNSILFQAASVLGPLIGGVVIATHGVGLVYALDAVSFLFLVASVRALKVPAPEATARRARFELRAIWDGFAFVFGRPLIRSTMLLDFFATFFASSTTLLPIFAQDVLLVGAHGYGLLSAATAVGAVLTSLAMAALVERIERRGRVLVAAVVLYGLVTAAFGVSRVFWLSFLCLMVSGAADTVSTVLRNVLRQLETPDELRGRMTSVNMMFFVGGPQLGEVEAGLVAQRFGPASAVVSGGLGCVLAALWLALRTPALRHYRRSATVPPAAST